MVRACFWRQKYATINTKALFLWIRQKPAGRCTAMPNREGGYGGYQSSQPQQNRRTRLPPKRLTQMPRIFFSCLPPPAVCLRQHRTIPALRLKHRSGGCGTASALPKCSIMSGCGTRIVHRGQKPLALCDRCPCFGSLHPPLAALTFAASSIICAFGLAAAAPRLPYRHLELCGIALNKTQLAAAVGVSRPTLERLLRDYLA